MAWSDKLVSNWSKISVFAGTHMVIELHPECCCDMRGAVEIAEYLMPGVLGIDIFAGKVPINRYERGAVGCEWEFINLEEVLWITQATSKQ